MTAQRRVALATSREFSALFAEEQQIVPALVARGIAAEPQVWDDPRVAWSSFDAVIVRSIWDYFEKYATFLGWLDQLESQHVRLFNPVSLVRWNADKHYLLDLERAGVPILPTALLERGSPETLGDLLSARGWPRAVIKPAVSGGAFHTHSVTLENAADWSREVEVLRGMGGALVQPFAPEIQVEGEWSLLFFQGQFSHAVLKRPAEGDFRVQQAFGASTRRVEPPAELVASAQQVIAALPTPALYARIDGIRRGGDFLLMEAEVIEPYLYLSWAPEKLGGFVEALASTV